MFDVIIPARNEAKTIAAVVRAAVRAHSVESVLVIDDGSQDQTGLLASMEGAGVCRFPVSRGKGQAMRHGLSATDAPFVVFLDADLLGFKSSHLDRMCEAIDARPSLDMVCGLRDYGLIRNAFQFSPLAETITGERVCRREMLEEVPADFWMGYAIEAGINGVCKARGDRVVRQLMHGVSVVDKTAKEGLFSGVRSHVRMFGEVGRAQHRIARVTRGLDK